MDLFNDILNHLKLYHANTKVDVTAFVKPYIGIDDKENTQRVLKIFDSLNSKNFIDIELTTSENSSVTQVNKQGQDFLERNGPTIGQHIIKASITNDGLHYLEQKERDKKQDELTKSVSGTNYWVKRTSIASAMIAFFTLVYIIKDFYKDTQQPDLSPIQKEIQ